MNVSPSLDTNALEELKAVMEGDFPILMEAFFKDSAERILQIKGSIKASDAEELRRTAHSFKGSSGNVGALKLQEYCRQLEFESKEGQFGKAPGLLAEIEKEFEVVKGLLAKEI